MKKATHTKSSVMSESQRLYRRVNGLGLNDRATLRDGMTVKCIKEARQTKDGVRRFSVSGAKNRSLNRGGYTVKTLRDLIGNKK